MWGPFLCAFSLMFGALARRMLASMSEIDPRADTPLVDWSELGVSGLLPTGTVTLLLADVENSTGLWESRPEQMTAAFARLSLLSAVRWKTRTSAGPDRIFALDAVPNMRVSADVLQVAVTPCWLA
ncbi:hypothetical protein MNVI_14480 [Mycobacterium noviomagense]|uniref:Uncharacterized protein n=1 Tax=Mycobacterium noviomagense TaxID=459858 RepID=A0A7I7PBZ4_9MYCO|nr:hypothetical protein BST37_16935 [Mycobacterium noviomagense]BBY06130.1 hypothetical protein MNVI_14480 [Mycobacterium noviomagense]